MMQNSQLGDFQTAQTLETFGFLPKFTQDEVYDQIAYLIAQGWTPAIEHEHPGGSISAITAARLCPASGVPPSSRKPGPASTMTWSRS